MAESVYHAAPRTLTANERINELEVDATGNLRVTNDTSGGSAPSLWSTAAGAAEGFKTVKATAGKLFTLIVTNETAATIYAQVHTAAAEPGAGVASIAQVKLLAGEQGSLDFTAAKWLPCATGITVAASSVSRTYTAVATAMTMTALYA